MVTRSPPGREQISHRHLDCTYVDQGHQLHHVCPEGTPLPFGQAHNLAQFPLQVFSQVHDGITAVQIPLHPARGPGRKPDKPWALDYAVQRHHHWWTPQHKTYTIGLILKGTTRALCRCLPAGDQLPKIAALGRAETNT